MAEKVICIEDHKVERAPSTAYYIPNFISEEEADYLWHKVYAAPLPKWTRLSNRNLQNWGGIPHAKGMVREDLPEWLERCCSQVAELGVFGSARPNHVLVNEYTAGQGIMPHQDGPLYNPVVTTISLGSTALLDFYRPIDDSEQDSKATLQDRYVTSLLLEPRSLVVLTDLMYTKYLHGIEARKVDTCSVDVCNLGNCATVYDMDTVLQRQTRVSLTIRNVPKVVKFDLLHHVLGRRANH